MESMTSCNDGQATGEEEEDLWKKRSTIIQGLYKDEATAALVQEHRSTLSTPRPLF